MVYGIKGIVRTGWCIPAGAGPVGREGPLVQANQSECDSFHLVSFGGELLFPIEAANSPALLNNSSTACPSSRYVAPAAAGLAATTMSQFSGSICWRRCSRSLRFTRLRTTALPTLRPTAKPNRVIPLSLPRIRRLTSRFDQLLPLLHTAAKSLLFLRRRSRPKACPGSWSER